MHDIASVFSSDNRLTAYPFALESELRDAAHEHGYRIELGQSAGWLFFASASAPGEIAVAATQAGMAGPFFLSVFHAGAARELNAAPAAPCAKGHVGAFVFRDHDSLFEAVRAVYRLSVSLPTMPYEEFVKDTAHLGDTEAERAQKVRIGQDRFRAALLEYWQGACPLTGITEPDLLRASHIIPWADCESDQERLNVHNGLLLSALWDAAFDSGLVTFDDHGCAIASPKLTEDAREALGFDDAPALSLSDPHRERLKWHRDKIWVGKSIYQAKEERVKRNFERLIEKEFGEDWREFASWMERIAFERSSMILDLSEDNLPRVIADYIEQVRRYSFPDAVKNLVSFEEIVEKNYSSLCQKDSAEEMFWVLFPDYSERD